MKADPGDLAEEYAIEAAKMLQEEIDWKVLCDLLIETGWTKVSIKWIYTSINSSKAHIISQWCKNNLIGHYKGRGDTWLFEHEKDAILFTLKWS